MRLAKQLGCTLAEAKARITIDELLIWIAFWSADAQLQKAAADRAAAESRGGAR